MYEPTAPADTLDGFCLAEEVIHALACGGLEDGERSKALAHLDDCEICQALLAEEVRALPPSPSADDATLLSLLQVEALVAGRYRIERFLARGGMGEVYEAWDTLLGEQVALKTINPVATTADQLRASARFKQEVQLSRRVGDPHVCRIYEFGQHLVRGFGTLSYLTMEFIEGQTLGARLRKGPRLELHEVAELSRQMLRGLGAAHAVGVLHRDFKSDNVMLRAKPEGPGSTHAVIMDFGLARLLGEQAHRLTERHELVGSAAYMAPEQVEEGAELSEATDIYAFGVVLFEMLTGRLPFEGKSAVAMALRRLSHPAPPPSLHAPELAGAWDELTLRCLEREVARRFASTAEVASALEACVHAPAPIPRRPRRGLAFAVASVAVLMAGVGLSSFRVGAGNRESSGAHSVTLELQPQSAVAAPRVETPVVATSHAATPPASMPTPDPAAAATPPSARIPEAPAPSVRDEGRQAPRRAASEAARTTPPRARAANPVRASRAATPTSAPGTPALAEPAAPSQDVRELFFLEAPSDRRTQKSD